MWFIKNIWMYCYITHPMFISTFSIIGMFVVAGIIIGLIEWVFGLYGIF